LRERYVRLCKYLKGEDLILVKISDAVAKRVTGYKDHNVLNVRASDCANEGKYVQRVTKGVYRFLDDIREEAGLPPREQNGAPPKPPASNKPGDNGNVLDDLMHLSGGKAPATSMKVPFNRTEAFRGLCRLLNGEPVNVAEITDDVATSLGWAHAGSCRTSIRYYGARGTFLGPSVRGERKLYSWKEAFLVQALPDYKPSGLTPIPAKDVQPIAVEERLQSLAEKQQRLGELVKEIEIERQDAIELLTKEAVAAVKRLADISYSGSVESALNVVRGLLQPTPTDTAKPE
jgi:hypothetical protein